MKQQNFKSQEIQNLGGTSTMERQTFKVSEQTYNNLVIEATVTGKSKSDVIREKLAMAAEYIDEFDFDDCIRRDSIDFLRTQLRERKMKDKPVDNIIEDILVLLDERFAKGKKLEKWEQDFYRENKKMVDLPLNLTEDEKEWLDNDW